MARTVRAFGIAAALAALFISTTCLAASSGKPVAQGRSPKLRIIWFQAVPGTVSRRGTVTFTVKVHGIRLSFKNMGKRPVAGEGHLQYYLDRIPRDAWKSFDRRYGFLAAAATPRLLFSLKASPVRFSRGRHHVVVALAKNNGVLYHAATASVTIKVK